MQRKGSGRWVLLALLGIIAVGAALRFTGLGAQAFWADEALTDRVLGLGGLWGLPDRITEQNEAGPPTYYMLVWIWARAFGADEAGLRSLSAVLGTLTIPVMYLAARGLAGIRAGLIAAALCASSPILVWYSQEARLYALYVLLVAVAFWLFVRALEEPSAANLIGWAAASVAATGTHYLAGIPAALEAGILIWRSPNRRGAGLAAGGAAVAIAAMLPRALDRRTSLSWISELPFGHRVTQTFEQFAVGNGAPARLVALAAAAIALAGCVAAVRGSPRARRGALICLAIAVGGIAISIAGGLFGNDYVLARNLLFAWVPLAAAVAIGLSSARLGALGPAAAALLCGLGVWLALEVKRDPELQRLDFRTAADLIGEPRAGETRTIVSSGPFVSTALRSYLPGIHDHAAWQYVEGRRPLPPSIEIDALNYGTPEPDDCWWGAPCQMPREPTLERPPPGFHRAARATGGGFVLIRYRARRPLSPEVDLGGAVVYQQGP